MHTLSSWESEPQMLHSYKGWLFSTWFPNTQVLFFPLYEHEWVPLMLLSILHGEEKEIEFQ